MTKRYRQVCELLGYRPEVRFVRLHRGGTIGFTTGKPQELRTLLQRVREKGLKPSKALVKVAGT